MKTQALRDTRGCARRRRMIIGGATAMAVALGVPGIALASTASTSTVNATTGALTIGSATPQSVTAPIGGTGTGLLPSAQWSNTTGNGTAWHGQVAVSDLTYTGTWTQVTGTTTPLGTATSAYTGTADGVEYTVTVGSGGTATSTPYSWTSTDPTTKTGGTGTATNDTAVTIGTLGIKINFAASTTYPAGAAYRIEAGTQTASAFVLDGKATGAGITAATTTSSTAPTFEHTGTVVAGGATVGLSSYGTAISFMTAAQGTGMGTYTVKPGIKVTLDPQSWKAAYKAGVQYTIATGP